MLGECFEEQGNITLKGALALFFQLYRIKRKTVNGLVEWVARGEGVGSQVEVAVVVIVVVFGE